MWRFSIFYFPPSNTLTSFHGYFCFFVNVNNLTLDSMCKGVMFLFCTKN